ncbi:hypothetical protein U1Q18_027258 [Sarracenia purpurea var. burkii]
MVRAMRVLALLFVGITLSISFSSTFCNGESAICIRSESQTLLNLKKDLKDPSNRLSSRTSEKDCCKWAGVVYDNSTGHVLELHLKNRAFNGEPLTLAKFEAFKSAQLGSAINPSLLSLKHLSLNILVSLDLNSCGFQGPIPIGLQNITALRELDLSSNNFNSTIPDWLYSLSRLEFLDFSVINFHGTILSVIGNLTSIIDLNLAFNNIQGRLPKSMGKLCNLRIIDLSGFKLEVSEVMELLSRCISDRLEVLRLEGNQISGQLADVIDRLGEFKHLNSLSLANNSFSGSIPESLRRLASLKQLQLNGNELTGALPVSLGQLTMLKELKLSGNELDGVVSEAHFENHTRLSIIDVSGNPIDTFEEEVLLVMKGKMLEYSTTLHLVAYLDLSNNHLSRDIPSELTSLLGLRSLNLLRNLLSGKIPKGNREDEIARVH